MKTFDDLDLEAKAQANDLVGLSVARAQISNDGIVGPSGNTILMHLASSSTKVLKHLVDLGEDPAETNDNGDTVLHIAAKYGYAEALELFVGSKSLVDQRNHAGSTPLVSACLADFGIDVLPCLRVLLRAGADPNPTAVGEHGLMYCLCEGRPWEPEAVRLLASSGTRVSQRNLDGSTALTKSLSNDRKVMIPSSRLVAALLEVGAQFDQHSGQFEKATRLAISSNDHQLLEHLNAEHGSVIDIRFNGMDSVLHEAFIHDAASACLAILEMGINPAIVNDKGETVASLAHVGPQCATVMASFLARKEAMVALDGISASASTKRM